MLFVLFKDDVLYILKIVECFCLNSIMLDNLDRLIQCKYVLLFIYFLF